MLETENQHLQGDRLKIDDVETAVIQWLKEQDSDVYAREVHKLIM
jgi:urease accessory protein UreE